MKKACALLLSPTYYIFTEYKTLSALEQGVLLRVDLWPTIMYAANRRRMAFIRDG